MWRALDNASIRIKLLIVPLIAVVALALTCATAIEGFRSEATAYAELAKLDQLARKGTDAATISAARLQADLFRLTAFGLMGVDRPILDEIALTAQRDDAALTEAVAALLVQSADASERGLLQEALDQYRKQGSDAVANLLDNPGRGATTARDAAVALDAVIAHADHMDDDAEEAVAAAVEDARAMSERQKRNMLALLAIGTAGVVLFNLLVARRIALPLRRLTEAMSRLAHKELGAEIPATTQRDEVGSMARAVEVFRDGMQRADALSRAQFATQRFLDAVLENVPLPIAVKDPQDRRIVYVNRATETFLGVTRDAVIGKTVRELYPAQDVDPFFDVETKTIGEGGVKVEDVALLHTPANGSRLAIVTRVVIRDADGQPQYLLSMTEDVTERRQAEQRITHMARHDTLTDLPNRASFGEELARAAHEARLAGTFVAVMCIDLDHFKDVNDTLGHAAGDKLLRTLGQRMRQCLRDGDMLARLGGDEFAVIQSSVRQPHDAAAIAKRLLEAAREPVELDGQQVYVGLSIGIALSADGVSDGELVQQADMALYEAKNGGRARFCFFEPEMDVRLRQRRAMDQDLRAAIGTEQILLHYQPQIDLASGAVVGAEALMRWNRPGHGPVPPDKFIPVAEETGLIGPLGAWLLQEACGEAMLWPPQLQIAVNVSPVQFRQPGFLDTVKQALAQSGLDPHRLELEVTEGILLHDTADTLAILAELRQLGVRLAMDDFGTGYASLGYLQKFRFDKIKIDKSFIRNLATDPNASAIVRAVVGLSLSLGMCTNAEGVEDQEQADLLRAHGCDEAQGYKFWRPMPAADLRALLGPPRLVTAHAAAD